MPSSLRARREPLASRPDTTIVAGDASAKRPLLGRLFGLFGSKPAGPTFVEPDPDALMAFRSEAAIRSEVQPIASEALAIAEVLPKPASRPRPSLTPKLVRPMLIVAAVVVVAGLTVLAIRRFPLPRFTAAGPQVGNLTINTRPAASEVLVDGVGRGTTPLTLALAPGGHIIVVRSGSDERVLPLTIAAGADVTHNFEMKAGEPAAQLGRVSVVTDPPGARVAIDGKPSGISPLTVANLTAAEHKVAVANETGAAERTVTVTPGGTASVLFSLVRVSGPVGGWLSITAPFDVEVSENDDVIGSSGASRIMLAAGRHNVTLSNRGLGFQDVRRIDVAAGKTAVIKVDAPKASVSVNARPWAEITLDGDSIGQTPIANLPISIGPHEMVFKHPQLGERKQTVTVSVNGPNRIAVDLTK